MCNILYKNKKIDFDYMDIFIYLYAFYIFFGPDLSGYIPLLKKSLILIVINIAVLMYYRKRFLHLIKNSKSFFLIGMLCFINLYTIIPSLINGMPLRNNLTSITFLLNIIALCALVFMVADKYKTVKEKLDFILNLGMIQAVICVLMVFIPSFKELANNIYISTIDNYDTSPLNGIVLYRIYGITNDYTFSTSILMSFLAAVALLMYMNTKRKSYLIYTALLLFSSMLNGRTGFIIFLMCCIVILYIYNSKKNFIKYLLYGFLIAGIMLVLATLFIDVKWLSWFLSSFKEIIESIFLTGNDNTLTHLRDFIFFPSGISFLFGYGTRVFGDLGISTVGKMSDIGYINEIWRGGVLYMGVFYTFLILLLKNTYQEIKKQFGKNFSNGIIFIIISFLFISNYKGESLAGSSILLLFVYLVSCFEYMGKKFENGRK